MTDFPRVRKCRTCPNCREPKDDGCVLCWFCHASQTHFHNGSYGENAMRKIANMEWRLENFGWPPGWPSPSADFGSSAPDWEAP